MVQFEEKLLANTVSRWADKYIAYGALNTLLSTVRKQDRKKKSKDKDKPQDPGERQRLVGAEAAEAGQAMPEGAREVSRRFRELIDSEVEKVEQFYRQKLDECVVQLDLLIEQSPDMSLGQGFEGFASDDERASLQRAFTELHRECNLLINFCILCYTGFRKILKKRDKVLPDAGISHELMPVVERQGFAHATEAEETNERVEAVYARLFCDGNRTVAKANLLSKKHMERNFEQLHLGVRMGACLMLVIWLAWDFLVQSLVLENHVVQLPAGAVYSACGGLILLGWMWAVCLFVWRSARINFIFLFELNPRLTHDHYSLIHECTTASLIYLANLLLYLKILNHKVPEVVPLGLLPFSLILFVVFKALFPLKKRAGVWRSVWQTVCAPLAEVTFMTTFIGDVLTSSVKTLTYLSFTACYVATGEIFMAPRELDTVCAENRTYKFVVVPLICAAPLWVRFMANIRRFDDTGLRFPNLANAGKYALSMLVVLFGAFHPLHDASASSAFQAAWMAAYVVSSVYSYWWDVYMDWGLGRIEFGGLGDRLMFRKRHYYYLAMAGDLLGRFCWTLTLLPPSAHPSFFGAVFPVLVGPLLMVIEIGRRTVWSFFRVENEHLRNTQGFRRVDVVPLHYDLAPHSKRTKAATSVATEAIFVSLAVALLGIGVVYVPAGRAL